MSDAAPAPAQPGAKNMIKRKTVADIWPVVGKRFLVRVDFNVPIADGKISNDLRIRAAIKTIDRIRLNGGIAVLMSHLGRPAGVAMPATPAAAGAAAPGYEAEFSLKPVAERLSELLGQRVVFVPDCLAAADAIAKLVPGDVALLENVRFYKEEGSKKAADVAKMSAVLGGYCDYFVSDAFGTAHRDSVTMTGVAKVIGHAAAGFLMEKEINYFAAALDRPKRPCVAIVGGSKVSDKILLLKAMLERIDTMLIGGAMAYTFLRARGVAVGKSRVEGKVATADGEVQAVDLAREIMAAAEARKVTLLLPVDHVAHTDFAATDTPVVTEGSGIADNLMGLDIGPNTIKLYSDVIRAAKTVIWNGPMGVFELPCYSTGTFTICRVLAECTEKDGLLSIIGGGDSATAIEACGCDQRVSHVSTGGGASLELLEGKDLPGVQILDPAVSK